MYFNEISAAIIISPILVMVFSISGLNLNMQSPYDFNIDNHEALAKINDFLDKHCIREKIVEDKIHVLLNISYLMVLI